MDGLAAILRCPVCRGELASAGNGLACRSCGRTYAVEDGIPLLLDDDLPGVALKRRESAGWVEKARREGWYEPDDAADARLPAGPEDDLGWLGTRHSFQVLLDRYPVPAGSRVLEVGAAKAWAAPHWRDRGCEYVATDVLVDPKIGLGRGAFYGDFARVQADGEHLPFADGVFDLVYCVATLHHALDLQRMVRELARVARPGAVVAALNEGTRPLGASADAPDQEAEKELGINEHVHTVWAYVWAFARAGLVIRRIEHAEGNFQTRAGWKLSQVPKIGTTLATLVEQNVRNYSGISIYGRKR